MPFPSLRDGVTVVLVEDDPQCVQRDVYSWMAHLCMAQFCLAPLGLGKAYSPTREAWNQMAHCARLTDHSNIYLFIYFYQLD